MRILIISFMLTVVSIADNHQFSQTPVKIPMYNGLDNRLGYPEFVDLDDDNDFDIVFMRDFDGPDYPIYYRNDGTDSIPQYVRDENMFAWLDGQYLPWDLLDLRMLDLNNDNDFDLVLFVEIYAMRSILFENIGDSNQPQWNAFGDTLFQNLGEVREINISNVLGDSLPQITVIHDSSAKFFRQINDSLVDIPGYFDSIVEFNWGINQSSVTKIEFFKLPQDTSQYLFVNRQIFWLLVCDYQKFEIYKNIGSKFQPNWERQEQSWEDGHCRFLKNKNSMYPLRYCYSDGFWSFSLLFDDLMISPTEIKFQNPNFWINGSSTHYKDLSIFDWQENGSQDIIVNCNNLWQEWDGWGYDSNLNMFLCLSDFQLDSTKTNYPFNFNFPLNVFEDDDPASLYFDFADLDADNDNDLMVLKSDNGYLGVSPFLRIYWNVGSDNLPTWDSSETIPFNHANWDKSVTLEDLDDDGDFDLIVSKNDLPNIKRFLGIYKNNGSAFQPQFTTVPDTLIKINHAHPTFADLDFDGDKDMVVQYDTTILPIRYQKIRYYRNDSNDTNFVFTRVDSILPDMDNISSPHLVDIDNDTDYDLFLLSNRGDLYFVENLTITAIPDNSIQSPSMYQLYQNFPNPFNSQTSIRFYIPQSAQVKIEIYNVLGQKIKTLMNQSQKSGMHQVVWDGRDENNKSVSSGVYIYNLIAGKYSLSKKLLLLK